MIHIAAPVPASAALGPNGDQYGPDWLLHQHLWEQTLEALKQVAALEEAKFKEWGKFYNELATTNFFAPFIDSANQYKILIEKDHLQVHFADGNVLRHDQTGLHIGDNQKVTAEVAKVVMKVALEQWGGQCTINPALSRDEQRLMLDAAAAAGVKVTNFELKLPSMDLSGITPTNPGPNPPPAPPSTPPTQETTAPPTPPADNQNDPTKVGSEPESLAAYLSAMKKDNQNPTLRTALHYEKMIATLVRHMRQADLLPATERAEATMAIVKAYKNGKLLDLPPYTIVKVKAKGLNPQARAEKIAAALAGNADGEQLVKTHYAKAMRVFDRRLNGIERIVDPAAQLHIVQDAMAELYRNNDRFYKELGKVPPGKSGRSG